MKIQILIDNISKNELLKEWGLSIYIEYNSKKILLDTGCSSNFSKNAVSLGIDLSEVDYGVLSHSHFDHSNGMKKFFNINSKAKFYLREGAQQYCYHHFWGPINYYIGIKKGWITKFSKRIEFVSGKYEICDGVYLLPHSTKNLDLIGKRSSLYIKDNGKIVPDSFKHEQSLIFEINKGLVIFNSCSHGGADNIIKEAEEAFPGKKIYAIIGGFHLFRLNENEIRSFAKRLLDTGIQYVVTGHCTGNLPFDILKEELGNKVSKMYSGMKLEI